MKDVWNKMGLAWRISARGLRTVPRRIENIDRMFSAPGSGGFSQTHIYIVSVRGDPLRNETLSC